MTKQDAIHLAKNILLLFVVTLFLFLFFDQYTTIKKIIMGIEVSKEEVLASMNLNRNLPAVFVISVLLGYRKYRKEQTHSPRTSRK